MFHYLIKVFSARKKPLPIIVKSFSWSTAVKPGWWYRKYISWTNHSHRQFFKFHGWNVTDRLKFARLTCPDSIGGGGCFIIIECKHMSNLYIHLSMGHKQFSSVHKTLQTSGKRTKQRNEVSCRWKINRKASPKFGHAA